MTEPENNELALAIETSGRTGSVAVGMGEKFLNETKFSAPMTHSIQLFPAVQALLSGINKRSVDVAHIYIAAGPGSFTGLRIAVTMAKMMAFAAGTRVVAADTMDVLAANATAFMADKEIKISRLATILDAKRKQFYVGLYENTHGQWKRRAVDCLMTASDFLARFVRSDDPIWLLGEGLVYYKDAFDAPGVRFIDPDYWPARAGAVYSVCRKKAEAGEFTDPAGLVPFYLRRPEAIENREKLNKTSK
ncbi:MAG: tRNA (adenosine(37)-N6)-threonylcarbamoyltransferase complex dimerization subunit type 1 TsaB [Planctomycetota bacterium]